MSVNATAATMIEGPGDGAPAGRAAIPLMSNSPNRAPSGNAPLSPR